ncbi:hypothetical protein M408DRAFT_28830 [Serendipita vermifera MAFF 305830]|uniref:Hemerythrin-like domain-containing protein n=1 Tax=Serendipita vermifera MAFF 305830 TaxID=933852 RepID=A0A0C3ASM7_SERVB|nr:hypothetical protein M408DRAFT_28830 [Serendipita vermifera MAFF 305830]
MSHSNVDFASKCNKSRPLFAKYCTGPAPTDPFEVRRWSMAGAHLMILEILANINNQLDTIPPEEKQNFALFCLFGMQIIEHHHHMEETVIFPRMQPEFTTDVVEEHAAFSSAMHELEAYLKAVLAVKQGAKNGQVIPIVGQAKVPFSVPKIRQILDTMIDPLLTHLEHELEWLAPENIRESGLPRERLEEIDAKAAGHIKNEMDTSLLVFGVGHVRPGSHFPLLPWVLIKVLVPWVFWWKDRKLWKFLPKSFAPIEL